MVTLSSSIFCYQRPSGWKQVAEEMPEILGLPEPIPLTSCLPSLHLLFEPCESQSSSAYYSPSSRNESSLHLFSPVRGPVTEADEAMRNFLSHRDHQKRLQTMALPEESSSSGCMTDYYESPSVREIRNPQFT
uniref:Protein aurora borealis n=1 Tax=Caenorhabditis tropicalis TaxID=1561998 RepID=A0A1I7TDA4_9PELO